jgi:hypothetical protein
MNLNNIIKTLDIEEPHGLYKWSKIFNRLQRNFFGNDIKLRREKQIEDFITLNGFKKVKFKTDTDVFLDFKSVTWCEHSSQADITVITDQKFSRYPCPVIIDKIQEQLDKCSNLYLCLNRHYINIDNSYHDTSLDSNFNVAIVQWLKKNLSNADVIDLSLDYVDYGQHFTWAIPDRHFFIRKIND